MTKTIQFSALAVACAALLSACGGTPSEKDMHAAVQQHVDDSNAQMTNLGGVFGKTGQALSENFTTKLHGFKKIGCKEDGENAYRCDVEIDIEAPLAGRNQQVMPMRFVKASQGWTVSP